MKNFFILFLITGALYAQPQLITFQSGSTASLRGLCGVTNEVCWASGSEGTVLQTTDGGKTWADVSPAGYDTLQFRDVHAFSKDTALILSAGLPAVILKTTNGGNSWKRVYDNRTKGVFFDAMDFWDKQTGMAFSDAQGTKLLIIKTIDGGETWTVVSPTSIPDVEEGQGGFAASGTCLKTFGDSSVIIGLGGSSATTLLSTNRGKTWALGNAPLDFGSPTKGIFSFDFKNALEGYCVGGDYTGDSATTHSIAKTTDGGNTWKELNNPSISSLYRSCISIVNANVILATSRTGISFSLDAGKTWKLHNGSYYSSSSINGTVWLSGPNGMLAKFMF